MTITLEERQIFEQSSADLTATLLQDSDDPQSVVPGSSLLSLTLTLYDVETGQIINQRDNQDVLNTNQVTVDENGLLTWYMQPEDTIIVTDELPPDSTEQHIALFTFTWTRTPLPDGVGREQVYHFIKQLAKVGETP